MRKISIIIFFAATLLAIGALYSFSSSNQTETMLTINKDDYEKEWKEIDDLEKEGLIKSALEKVEALYLRAKQKTNSAQIVKCLLYRGKYKSQLEENGYINSVYQLQKEIETVDSPTKAILQSVLAELYSNYLDQNQWRFRDRTETADFKNDDIQTWTIKQLQDESSRLYLASIADEQLKKIAIEDIDAITYDGKYNENLRPTLFDFLANRAIEYFLNDRSYLTEPAYKFYINQKEAFADAKTFANYTFKTKDTDSKKYQGIVLFQKIIKAHLEDKNTSALIDIDLKRLKFVNNQAVIDNKDQLYLDALDNIINRYKSDPIAADVAYQKAQYYFDKAGEYQKNPEDEGKWDYKTAHDICTATIKQFPESIGAKNCKYLISRIEGENVSLEQEKVNLPNEPILTNVRYKNVAKVHFRLAKVDIETAQKLNQRKIQAQRKLLKALPSVKEWSEDLPLDGDFRNHSVEIKVEPQKLGVYVLVASEYDDFRGEDNWFVYSIFHVSNIASLIRSHNEKGTEVIVVHRKTGEPLANVKAELYNQVYNQRSRVYDYIRIGEKTSDQNGIIKFNSTDSDRFRIKFTKGKDVLFLNDNYSNYRNRPYKNQERSHTHFFLDRAIYRPGQTVYFKGIEIKTDKNNMPTIEANKKVEVVVLDANHQEVEKINLITNEYGTITGSFTAPKSGLLGSMYLRSNSNNSSKSFRVEEYKRPKFETVFEPVKGSFRFNDEVTVIGNAKAFAGSNVDGAKVTYRVVREVSYPYMPWWYFRYYPYQSSSMEIVNGETTTDEKGAFEIKFKALPDLSISKEKKPQFSYKVFADVIDITGETQSANTSVSVGYIALQANMLVPESINRDSQFVLKLKTENLNGVFEAAKGTISIEGLKTPDRVFKTRYWEKPDRHIMTAENFKKDFPNFAFKDEDEIQNWSVEKEVYQASFNTAEEKEIKLNTSNWKAGKYIIKLKTKDKYDQAIELERLVTVYDLDANTAPANEAYFHLNENERLQPDDRANIFVGSAYKTTHFLFDVEHNGDLVTSTWLDVNGMEKTGFPIVEKYRGNVMYSLSMVKENRVYIENYTVYVPWTNKELNIEYATFRNKLYPGQEEEWQVKISGNKKEKIAAEMVAAMYDASLDQFVKHNWGMSIYPTNYKRYRINSNSFSNSYVQTLVRPAYINIPTFSRQYRRLNWFDYYFRYNEIAEMAMGGSPVMMDQVQMESAPPPRGSRNMKKGKVAETFASSSRIESSNNAVDEDADGVADMIEAKANQFDNGGGKKEDFGDVKVRTNLNETVFFMPNLKTDAEGNVIVKFTMNEALTRWKFLGLAHTKDLKFGFTENEVVTQKDLMVMPNAPRFMREGDEIEFTAKVSNLSEKDLQGEAKLELFDALTMKPIDDLLGNTKAVIPFQTGKGQSDRLAWKLKIPTGEAYAITHRVIAKAANFSDGEESTLPILTNRMLVTETLPLPVRGKESKTFTFKSMQEKSTSSTLQNHKYTLEFTSNPAWYAVQALPYMMEYPYKCTEQIFSRYYANSLATSVANAHPKVKKVFDQWKNTDAMLSNLSKNQELKTALLEETPWVLQAQSEEEQKKNIGLLFDLDRMSQEQDQAMATLLERQLGNGGFSWFPGGKDSWYITQYLVEGMGHLDALGVQSLKSNPETGRMLSKAVSYIDDRIVEHYEDLEKLVKKDRAKFEDDHLDQIAIHYLYARSFFKEQKSNKKTQKVVDYYKGQAKEYWLKKGNYLQGMLGLALHRDGDTELPTKIVNSLEERSLNNEEMGKYWKYNRGYYWYQHPIETHSLMIELFAEVAKDEKAVDDLKVWLLKNKQTNHWKTTKATASAVYALLSNGDNWLLDDQLVNIKVGGKEVKPKKKNVEAGTGYFKTAWDGKKVSNDMSTIEVTNPNNVVAWGAVYWQYFEQLDKITTFEETPLTLKKQLFREENSPTGPVMKPINSGVTLSPGDKLKVRIELRVDRGMEYVHMKDMRASGFEPINVLSQYKWKSGLGYYESTRDASTNFFFSYLPKGTHVFEYPLRVNHKGDFSNGITTIQCMYAPEFTSHSEGIRVKVTD